MTVGGKKKGRHMSQLEDGVAQSAIEAPPSAGGLVAPAPPTLDLDFTIESVRIPQSLAGTIGDRVVGYNSFSQFSQTFFSPTVNDPSYRMPQYQQAAILVGAADLYYDLGDSIMAEARGVKDLGDTQRQRIAKPYLGGSLEGVYIKSKVVKFRMVRGALCTEDGWTSFDHLPAAEAADIQHVCKHHFEKYPWIYQELRTTLWKNVLDRVVMMVPGHPVYIPASQENWNQLFCHHITHGRANSVEIIIGFVCGSHQPVEGKLSLVDPRTGGIPTRQVATEQASEASDDKEAKAIKKPCIVDYEVEEMIE